jgi:hypothetical protein
VVQLLLNLSASVGAHPLRIDGTLTQQTIFAIETFQRDKVRLARPDGLVEQDSLTTRTLATAARASIQRTSKLPAAQAGETLSDSDYQRAASALSCEVAAVKAVSQVESAGAGFLPSKQPKILFEAHVFSKSTHHKYDRLFPDISSRHWNRALYRGGQREYPRLQKAMLLDRAAALGAASWGRFQILGSNHAAAGTPSLEDFIAAMFRSEGGQLDAFVAFLQSTHLVEALRQHDWTKFARGYNGPKFSERHYDLRIKEQYERFAGAAKK